MNRCKGVLTSDSAETKIQLAEFGFWRAFQLQNEVSFGIAENDVVGFTPAQRTAIELQLSVSIAFESTWLYRNFRYPRHKNAYGYAQVMAGAFVAETVPLYYLNQEVLYWFDETFGINETTGCYAKNIAEMLPEGSLVVNTVKRRQRFTSVRFRMFPGILANVNLAWQEGSATCGGNVVEPNEEQGNSPEPNNQGWNPGARPPGQGGDPLDPTYNDGFSDPADPEGDPPSPMQPGFGQWYVHGIWSSAPESTSPTGETNPDRVWSSPNQCHEGQDGAVAPAGRKGRSIYLDGVYYYCAQDPSRGDLLSVYFEYH